MGLMNKLQPLLAKVRGSGTLAPWRSVLGNLSPATFRVKPPGLDISVVMRSGNRHLLRFAGKDDFWFPLSMEIREELWSEYLATFWNHPGNAHYYLRKGAVLTADDVVFDCGACEGFFARYALDKGVRKVICIEPSPVMVDCLHATFAQEIEQEKVVIVPAGVASHCGQATFSAIDSDAFSGRLDHNGAVKVDIRTLDVIAENYGEPSFVKMDLEGFEYEALRGGVDLLRAARPKLAVTTYHYEWDYQAVRSLLHGLGYRRFGIAASTMRGSEAPRPMMIHAW